MLETLQDSRHIIVRFQRKARHELLADTVDGVHCARARDGLDVKLLPLRELLDDQRMHHQRRNRELAGMHLHGRSVARAAVIDK